VEELVADIMGSISCCSTLSFYDGAGHVDGAQCTVRVGFVVDVAGATSRAAQHTCGWCVQTHAL
jgi:hypothetical protein